MISMRLTSTLALLAAAVLAGCASPMPAAPAAAAPVETRTPVATAATPAAPAPAARPAGTPQSQVATADLTRGAAGAAGAGATAAGAAALLALPSERIVYFDFDSFAIRDEFKPLLDGHAKALAANRTRKLVIEGHTDERGGREYNLALGQKRADAVLRSLTILGVSDAQVEAVSFGKERPAAQGNDEAAWAKNRRAELKDR
jgi:peptidoglycan-associated lipoprotein